MDRHQRSGSHGSATRSRIWKLIFAAATTSMAVAGFARGTGTTFNHGDSTDDWADTKNWSAGAPATGVEAVVDSTYVPSSGAFTLNATSLTAGDVVFNVNNTLSLLYGSSTRTLTVDGTVTILSLREARLAGARAI